MIDLIVEKLDAAKNGDVEAARWLIKDFVETVKQNRDREGKPHRKPSGTHTQFDERLLDYLVECFEKIDKLTTADIAFNLAAKGRIGPKIKSSIHAKQLSHGFAVYRLRQANHSFESAIEEIAQQEKKSVALIRKAYGLFNKQFKNWDT